MQTFQVGDQVRVKGGSFAGQLARIESLSPEPGVYRCILPDLAAATVFGAEELEPAPAATDEPQPMSRLERGLLFVEREELEDGIRALRYEMLDLCTNLREVADAIAKWPLNFLPNDVLDIDLTPLADLPDKWRTFAAMQRRLTEIDVLLHPKE